MADGQEIYIRNPLVVLNVDLSGMQAPRLSRVVSVVHAIPVLVNGSLSKVTSH